MIAILHIMALSIFLLLFFPENAALKMVFYPKQSMHIILATLTFVAAWLTALQAIFVMLQDCLLRHNSTSIFVKRLPPLETMERILFNMLMVAFILMSITLASSAYFFDAIFQFPLLGKTLLVFAAWLVFGILLIGRHFSGWRGRKSIYYTLFGFSLLVLIYFGSNFVTG